jgi:DNA mismatch repair protein MutL
VNALRLLAVDDERPALDDLARVLRAQPAVATVDTAESGEEALHALAGGDDLAKALACKGSKRFGENLSNEEMELLLKEWSATEFREICPHGRPIAKRLSLVDLLREFGRI